MSITLSLVKNLSRLNENRAKAHIAIEMDFEEGGNLPPVDFITSFYL